MTETKRKARKKYKCDYCEKDINKGDIFLSVKDRSPKYESLDNCKQIGINYYNGHIHLEHFECFLCKEKSDDFIWPISELGIEKNLIQNF